MAANQRYRKPLPGTDLEYYDARAAREDIQAGSYDKLPYTPRIWRRTWSTARTKSICQRCKAGWAS